MPEDSPMKPAPGPYELVEAGVAVASGAFHACVIDVDGRKIAAVWGRKGEKSATAALLAAAPDLLAALKELHARWRYHTDDQLHREVERGNVFASTILRGRAAIQKADYA